MVQKWLKPAVMVALSVSFLLAFLLLSAYYMRDIEPLVRLPLLTLIGVIALLASITFVAVAFSALGLSDKSQALSLPEGSVRAVIALSLIVIFAVVTIYLYTTIPAANQPAQDFAKQLLVMLGTLITSVSGFYFGAQTAAAGAGSTKVIGTPTLTRVEPNQLKQGSSQPFKISGTDLQLANSAKIVLGGSEIAATDVTSDASIVKCQITIPATATLGKWDVLVATSDQKTAKLAQGVEVIA